MEHEKNMTALGKFYPSYAGIHLFMNTVLLAETMTRRCLDNHGQLLSRPLSFPANPALKLVTPLTIESKDHL